MSIEIDTKTYRQARGDGSVVSNADVMLQAIDYGTPDECAILSMVPGRYAVTDDAGTGIAFTRLKLLAGAGAIVGRDRRTRLTSRPVTIPDEPLVLEVTENSQMKLSSRRDEAPELGSVLAITYPPTPPPKPQVVVVVYPAG